LIVLLFRLKRFYYVEVYKNYCSCYHYCCIKESSTATTAQAVGVITAIDTKENILTLDHEAIPAIKWPAMTMGFKVADPVLLSGLTVGDKVDFELKAEGENYIVITVKAKNL